MNDARRQRLESALSKRQPDITVILENVFDPHNISAVMRTCDAIGMHEMYVLNHRIQPHRKWGRHSSSSADKWMVVHQFTDLDACVAAVRQRYGRILTTHLDEQSADLYDLDLTGPVALVFGNERKGCTPEMVAAADGNFVIPQVGIISSLNISVACAVTLYEAFRQKRQAGHYDLPKLDGEMHRALAGQWGFWYKWGHGPTE